LKRSRIKNAKRGRGINNFSKICLEHWFLTWCKILKTNSKKPKATNTASTLGKLVGKLQQNFLQHRSPSRHLVEGGVSENFQCCLHIRNRCWVPSKSP